MSSGTRRQEKERAGWTLTEGIEAPESTGFFLAKGGLVEPVRREAVHGAECR